MTSTLKLGLLTATIIVPTAPALAFSSSPYSDWKEPRTAFSTNYRVQTATLHGSPTIQTTDYAKRPTVRYNKKRHVRIKWSHQRFSKKFHKGHLYRTSKKIPAHAVAMKAVRRAAQIERHYQQPTSQAEVWANVDSNSSASFWAADRGMPNSASNTTSWFASAEPAPVRIREDRRQNARYLASRAQAYGVPVPLALAIGEQESGFRANAVSNVGARGLMQVMPATWRQIGCAGNPYRAEDSAECGLKYLAMGLRETNGSIVDTAKFYFGGPNKNYHGRKTIRYGQDIQARYSKFARLASL